MQNLFATVLLEELGIVVENRREVLSLLSVVVVQDGESLNVLGVRVRLLRNEFNQTHFAHLEHHVDDELEDSANVGEDNDLQESGQEVEQQVQLEEEQDQPQQVPPQDVQLDIEVEQVPQQDVQLAQEVEQEVEQDIQEGQPLQVAQPILGGIENIPQQQLDVVEGIAEGMVFVEEMPDIYGEQENVNPNIMNAPIQFVGIPVQEGVALGVLQEQVVNIQEPPALPPQQHDEIIPHDNDNGGEVEVEELEEFDIQVLEVEVDGDGDVVMLDLGEGDGEAGEGIDAQEPQIGHRYPLRDTRARREYREREQQRREREGDRNERGRRILGAQCLLYLRTRQLELASRSFSQFQCMNQDLTEKTEISPPLSILQQILHFKIHLQSGQHQLTEEELSQLLDNQGSKNELILYLIDEYITWAPANIEILVSLFAKRTSPDPEILVKTAACILRKEQMSESDDQVVLSLLNNASNRESILRQQILMKSCYALLWNRGVIQFDSKQFTSATIFFEASYSYSAAQDRAKTARAVGLCLLGSRNYSRALEWIALCHSVAGEHLEVADCFVSFKLALLRCDCEACEDSINLMIKCHDFEPHIMKIACQEAISSGMHKLAKKTLRKLHQMSLENASILQGLTESAILRCLIKCSLEILQIVYSNEEDYNEIINEICSEFDLVVKRLDSVGFNTFFGVFSDSGDVSVFAELEWFCFQSWNLALSSAEKEDHEKATVLFASSAMLMSNHPQPIHKQNSHTKTAYLLAASSALKIHDLNIDKNEAKSKSSLQTAKELIKRNKAIKEKDITDSDFLELFLDFEFVKRSGQMESLKRLIEGSRKSRSISGEHLIKLGMSFKDVAYQDPEISRMIFRIALQKLTAESSPRFDRIFMVQRMLIQQTYDLSQKLTLFQEALQLIQFHKRCASSFPAKEIHWLVASCWNQGLHDMRFNRREMALNFMTTSISLIEYCPELNERKESMLQEIERIKLSN
eukprot:g4247.t1